MKNQHNMQKILNDPLKNNRVSALLQSAHYFKAYLVIVPRWK